MSLHTVGGVEISGAAIDVLYKLFYFGSQDDGDLPSKSGMSELINLGWAVKNYNIPNVLLGELPNSLSITGMKIAREYYRDQRKSFQDDLFKMREDVKQNLLKLQESVSNWAVLGALIEQARPAYVELSGNLEQGFFAGDKTAYVATAHIMSKFDLLFNSVEKKEPIAVLSYQIKENPYQPDSIYCHVPVPFGGEVHLHRQQLGGWVLVPVYGVDSDE